MCHRDVITPSIMSSRYQHAWQVSPTPAGNGKEEETTSGIIVNLFQQVIRWSFDLNAIETAVLHFKWAINTPKIQSSFVPGSEQDKESAESGTGGDEQGDRDPR